MIFILTFETAADRDKFEYLYNTYKNLLMHKAYEILRDFMLAEDAVSEAYLRAYKNLHKIEDPASGRAAAFLVTITRNVCLTMLKKGATNVAEEPEGYEQPDDVDLEESVVSSLTSEHVYAMLGSLDAELKDIFMLKFAHDMSHRQIAETLGISENNVAVKLHRAKKKLADMLAKEGYRHDQ